MKIVEGEHRRNRGQPVQEGQVSRHYQRQLEQNLDTESGSGGMERTAVSTKCIISRNKEQQYVRANTREALIFAFQPNKNAMKCSYGMHLPSSLYKTSVDSRIAFLVVHPTGIPEPCRKKNAATDQEAVPMAAPAPRRGLRPPQIYACINEI